MKLIKIILMYVILLIFCNSLVLQNNTAFNKIINKVQLKEDEKVILFFASPFDCPSCNSFTYGAINCLKNNNDITTNYKIVALVKCDREKELKIFKDRNNWSEFAMVNKDNYFQKNLDINMNSTIAIIDYSGNKIAEFQNSHPKLCEEIIKCINIYK